ncbi:MAG: ABC transporter permease, partial [Sedimenticolaceae bacterium]
MITEAFSEAFRLISSGDSDLFEILELSIQVGSSSLLISMLLGLPLGTVLAISRFPGKQLAVTTLNSLMGMPPVVVGLLVYLLLSRSGPLGVLGLLYTPTAMVIAQVVLITPIIA